MKFWTQFREGINNAVKTGVLKPNFLLGSGVSSAGCQRIGVLLFFGSALP